MPESVSDSPQLNPLADALALQVAVPKVINVRMVQAEALSEYEAWIYLSSLFSSGFVGFLVAFVQGANATTPNRDWALFWLSTVLLIAFGICFAMARKNRKRMTTSDEIIPFAASRDQLKARPKTQNKS